MIYRNASPVSSNSESEEDDEIIPFSNSQNINSIPLPVRLSSAAVTSSSSASSPRTAYFNYLNDDLRKRVQDYMNIMTTQNRSIDVDEFIALLGDIMRTLPPAKQLELKIQIIQLLLEYEEKARNRNQPEE